MERLITTIFKIFGASIILSVMLDTGALVFDTFATINRLNAVATSLQMEISKYNGLPSEELRDVFAQRLADASVNSSNVVTNITSNFSANSPTLTQIGTDTDFSGAVNTSTDSFADLSVLKGYGDTQSLFIGFKVNVIGYAMPNAKMSSFVKQRATWAFSMTYDVPCLRYRKTDT